MVGYGSRIIHETILSRQMKCASWMGNALRLGFIPIFLCLRVLLCVCVYVFVEGQASINDG